MELLVIIGIIMTIVNAVKKRKKETEQAAKRRAAVLQAEQRSEADRIREAEEAKARSRQNMAEQAARAEQRAAAFMRQKQETQPVPQSRWRCPCGRDNDANASFCTACGKARFGGSMNARTWEGRGASLEGRAVSSEGRSDAGAYMPGVKRQEVKTTSTTAPGGAKAARHVVKPLTESSHSHVESSISGVAAECAVPDDPVPVDEDAYRIEEAAAPVYSFAFDRSAAVQGLIYSEILGRPKARRR